MARIPLRNGFTICPEGTHVFRIYDVDYDETFGTLIVKMVNAQGLTHQERYQLKDANDNPNEGALNAFSFFAKNAMNDFAAEDLDPNDLVNHYVRATIEHTTSPSKKDPSKNVTFANAKDFSAADGFDTTPTDRAMTLGNEGKSAPAAAPAPAVASAAGGFDLASLLG